MEHLFLKLKFTLFIEIFKIGNGKEKFWKGAILIGKRKERDGKLAGSRSWPIPNICRFSPNLLVNNSG